MGWWTLLLISTFSLILGVTFNIIFFWPGVGEISYLADPLSCGSLHFPFSSLYIICLFLPPTCLFLVSYIHSLVIYIGGDFMHLCSTCAFFGGGGFGWSVSGSGLWPFSRIFSRRAPFHSLSTNLFVLTAVGFWHRTDFTPPPFRSDRLPPRLSLVLIMTHMVYFIATLDVDVSSHNAFIQVTLNSECAHLIDRHIGEWHIPLEHLTFLSLDACRTSGSHAKIGIYDHTKLNGGH